MNVTENPAAAHQLLERVRSTSGQHRAPGLHVSDLLYCARKAWTRMHVPEYRKEDGETDDDTLIFLLGRGHHELLEQEKAESKTMLLLGDHYVHASIDGVEPIGMGVQVVGNQPLLPIEFKTTRKSSNNSILTSANYIDQLASYCLAMGVTKGRLYVAYLLGDWKGPKTPQFKAYDFTFGTEELLRWQTELEVRTKVIMNDLMMPPLHAHWTWECKRCPVKQLLNCPGGKGDYDGGFFHSTQLPWQVAEPAQVGG